MGTTMLIKGKIMYNLHLIFFRPVTRTKMVFINVWSFFISRIKIFKLFVLKFFKVRLLIANGISSINSLKASSSTINNRGKYDY